MPQQGINFGGQFIGLPGVYYADNVSAAGNIPPPLTPPLLVIGYGWGPKPKTPITFSNSQNMYAAVRGAPVASFIPFFQTPSPTLNGAQQITFIDASQNTQSQAALSASGALGVQTLLTSVQYGPPSNQLLYTVQPGTTAGRKVTLYDGYGQTQLVGDNLTVPLQLAYSGTATGAVSYTVTTGVVSGTFACSSPIAGESVSIPIGSGGYSTVSQLVQYLNGTGNYFAQLLSSSQGLLPSLSLSPVTAATLAIPTTGQALQYSNVGAYLQDIAFWVNQFASTLATATVSGTAQDNANYLPVTGTPTFFSGARGVPPVNADYAAALTVALTTPAWVVFCDSNTPAVQALLAQHCEIASSPPNNAWRRGFTGSSLGDSVTTTIVNSRNINSYQVAYVYPGIWAINTNTGASQLYSGLYAAAMAASMATGNQIAQPLTNKPLSAIGVEQPGGSTLSISQLIQLQNNGVMCVYQPQQTNVPTILSDMTTWETDNNVENTSSQQVACRFWLAYSMITALQPYVGSIASPIIEIGMVNAAKRTLNKLIYAGGSSNGILASWDAGSLILVFTSANQLAAVNFSATLVSQNRYITEQASIQPLNFTISVTG
jgi:hypothetical protein